MSIEAMKLALDALDIVKIHYTQNRHINEAITALKERLLEAPMREVQRLGQEIEQEPICPACKAEVLYECVACSSNNYPPQRTWVGLTDEDLIECERLADIRHRKHMGSIRGQQLSSADQFLWHYARAIEAKLKEKNT